MGNKNMSDKKFTEIGKGIVLDPADCTVRSYVEVGGQLCAVDRIINEAIYFRTVTGFELYKYRIQSFYILHKHPVWIGSGVLLLILMYHFGVR
jgi:hypothetical protein